MNGYIPQTRTQWIGFTLWWVLFLLWEFWLGKKKPLGANSTLELILLWVMLAVGIVLIWRSKEKE